MSGFEAISNDEKARIARDFITHAPPGEFNEVFNDVRVLVDNDTLLKEGASSAFVTYNKDQFTPVEIDGDGEKVLVTEFNDLGNGKFLNPSTKKSFKFDHLKKVASESQSVSIDNGAESWRAELEKELKAYRSEHYKHGNIGAFGRSSGNSVTLIACIEDHQFQPKNFWNGRWRSQWALTFDTTASSAEAKGVLKVQVHYYEDGNVQLVSHKDIKEKVPIGSEAETAKSFLKVIRAAETEYQTALSEDYIAMSDTTFKALRRVLPITRTKIDWHKITGYQIGQALKSDAS
ncbi:F-actin-capping protein subunit alpha [Holothuria leucospilota]|uniref:F-actin-capping protein subunit alpha n=1 Tax=Holothuria leucospilota TaxID=206669 RepID=A0A9Q1CM79_HOLLE|nr:F-actin-capping protein subunit alpha [Holothuria leucospilota]